MLALVVCALALTVAVPLRNYVAQRQELAAVTEQQQALAAEVDELDPERARLVRPGRDRRRRPGRGSATCSRARCPTWCSCPADRPARTAADAGRRTAGGPWYRGAVARRCAEGAAH